MSETRTIENLVKVIERKHGQNVGEEVGELANLLEQCEIHMPIYVHLPDDISEDAKKIFYLCLLIAEQAKKVTIAIPCELLERFGIKNLHETCIEMAEDLVVEIKDFIYEGCVNPFARVGLFRDPIKKKTMGLIMGFSMAFGKMLSYCEEYAFMGEGLDDI